MLQILFNKKRKSVRQNYSFVNNFFSLYFFLKKKAVVITVDQTGQNRLLIRTKYNAMHKAANHSTLKKNEKQQGFFHIIQNYSMHSQNNIVDIFYRKLKKKSMIDSFLLQPNGDLIFRHFLRVPNF